MSPAWDRPPRGPSAMLLPSGSCLMLLVLIDSVPSSVTIPFLLGHLRAHKSGHHVKRNTDGWDLCSSGEGCSSASQLTSPSSNTKVCDPIKLRFFLLIVQSSPPEWNVEKARLAAEKPKNRMETGPSKGRAGRNTPTITVLDTRIWLIPQENHLHPANAQRSDCKEVAAIRK